MKLHGKPEKISPLTARETHRSGPSLGALMENFLKFQSTLNKLHNNWWIFFLSFDISKSDSKTPQL